MTFCRVEKDGQIAYVEGKRVLRVPAVGTCREKLVKVLEEAGGDKGHEVVKEFWRERAKDTGSDDPLKAAWAAEVFERLSDLWDQLTTPPTVAPVEPDEDVFKGFGL